MKFKAVLTERGLRTLGKGEIAHVPVPGMLFNMYNAECCCAAFLPTFEKFGKTCQLLLGPTDIHLIQTAEDTGGAYLTARLAVVRAGSLRSRDRTLGSTRCCQSVPCSMARSTPMRDLRQSTTSAPSQLQRCYIRCSCSCVLAASCWPCSTMRAGCIACT
jgi:hypothetical protein